MIDWTKVGGSAVLLAGGICMKMFTNLPDALIITIISLVPAMWALPPIARALGIKV